MVSPMQKKRLFRLLRVYRKAMCFFVTDLENLNDLVFKPYISVMCHRDTASLGLLSIIRIVLCCIRNVALPEAMN